MKLTKSKLNKLIKEELAYLMEAPPEGVWNDLNDEVEKA